MHYTQAKGFGQSLRMVGAQRGDVVKVEVHGTSIYFLLLRVRSLSGSVENGEVTCLPFGLAVAPRPVHLGALLDHAVLVMRQEVRL